VRHHRAGQLGEAETAYRRTLAVDPDHFGSLYHLGIVALQRGQPAAAVEPIGRAIALNPDAAECRYNMAVALQSLGRLEQAAAHYEEAIRLKPDYVEAQVNLGLMLLQEGKLDAAAAQLDGAAAANQGSAEIHCARGNLRSAQGRPAEAESSFRRALELEPDLPAAHNGIGILLGARGRLAEASRHFRAALRRKPDFIDAYNNLGRAFMAMGEVDNALGALRRALAINETADTRLLIVQCMKMLGVPPDAEDFRALLVRALSEPWTRPTDLARIASRAVKQEPALNEAIARVAAAWPRRLSAAELLGSRSIGEIARIRLLRCLLQTVPVSELKLERFLTVLRAAMLRLAASPDTTGDAGAVELCCALAEQCFLNEQVFARTDEEMGEARRQRDIVVAKLACGEPIPELVLAAVACYFPLHTLDGAGRLLDRSWSAPVAELLLQQVREPAEEMELRASILVLTPIDDAVSRRVREQYEDNPYPSWVRAEPPAPPLPLDLQLQRRLPLAPFVPTGRTEVDVLIAGCGTGQHAIEAAQRLLGARLLAVDLSRASLAFALRKTRALGIGSIEYAQADLLGLGSLARSFDLIEALGVLHHLADPLAGWRRLLALLRPRGVMAIGLYSEIARAGIVGARAFIAERGYRPTADDIRRCRQELIAADGGTRFRTVTGAEDFFTTSSCRDLLFHVQEHRFTLAQIADFIAANGLAFLGFDLPHYWTARYLERFPRDTRMTDLASWEAFEREHPNLFSGMYQFCVQKPH
jgi:tetratricopeptide (TPR) repeat protein/SAM-dependent methyltransferase